MRGNHQRLYVTHWGITCTHSHIYKHTHTHNTIHTHILAGHLSHMQHMIASASMSLCRASPRHSKIRLLHALQHTNTPHTHVYLSNTHVNKYEYIYTQPVVWSVKCGAAATTSHLCRVTGRGVSSASAKRLSQSCCLQSEGADTAFGPALVSSCAGAYV